MMIKISIIAVAILGGIFASLADSFRPEGASYQPPTNIEIVWQATNTLPSGLWVYKAIPQNFSTAAISNLMAIGGFDWKNLLKRPDSYIPDKNLFRFVNKKQNWTSYVVVAPTFGWIEYSGDDTNSPLKLPEGVPSKAEAERLASDVLFQLGIDRSLLCDKRSGYETVGGKLSPDGQRLTTNVYSRGVSYSRQIDGVESRNSACFIIEFGSHAQIMHFRLSWRNLSPYEAHPTLTSDQMIEAIKDGRTKAWFFWEDLSGLNQAKKLTVVKMTPYYSDAPGEKPVDFIRPYAKLDLIADYGTNTSPVYLECPILSTNAFGLGIQTRE